MPVDQGHRESKAFVRPKCLARCDKALLDSGDQLITVFAQDKVHLVAHVADEDDREEKANCSATIRWQRLFAFGVQVHAID